MGIRIGTWCCVAVLFSGVAWSQASSPRKRHFPGADVYAGYSLFAPPAYIFPSPPPDTGFGFGGDLYLSHWLAVAAESYWMHVTFDPEDKSSSVTAFGGPRVFLHLGSHGRIVPYADFLGGAVTYGHLVGFNQPFANSASPAFATDAGVDVRAFGPFSVRVQGGYVHTSFTAAYPPDPNVRNQHGRLLIEGVWRF